MTRPAYRRFNARELRLSRSLDQARQEYERACDAGDEVLARAWLRLVVRVERLIEAERPSR